MEKQIEHKWQYPHTPEVVWDYLTKPELMAQWLMENDFEPIVGHDFQFRTKPLPNFNFDGIVYCTVLEVVPCSRLSYSWKGGPGNGVTTLDSVVEWTLTPRDGGTELLLQHFGFKDAANIAMFTAMDEGWLKNIKKIETLINTVKHDTNV